MKYVVKVGEYYVNCRNILGNIILTKGTPRFFGEDTANKLAKRLNGTVIEIKDM